ncbi:DUF6263 family protein [Urbifossiella limnaea]|uniref:DUF945 family protein n=1 Tax=Urbifossiella limnaea TaxID=2528023 RepID=A0A517XX37_9BACT|nr:DUF6263 family protein [Urbifossiella limnaea]QDU22082.1 hypothetical protein ETAA1_40570 [Urbifossiella limnaea]
MSRVRVGVAGLFLASLAVVALVASRADAQDKQSFTLKLEKDKAFYQKTDTVVAQIIKVQGQDLTQKQQSTFFFKWTPEKIEGEKATLKQKVEGLFMSIDISGNPIIYDSAKKEPAGSASNPGLMDFFKGLEGTEFTVVLNTKSGAVEKVDGKEELAKKLGAGSAQMDSLLKKILTDDSLKQMADPTAGLLTDAGRAVGDKWDRKTTLNLGPVGSYEVKYDFTYKGKDEKLKHLDRIEVSPTITFKSPTESTEGLLFKIKSGTLETKALDPDQTPSVILFNSALGRIEKATISLKMEGELLVGIGGNDTKVALSQRQTTTVEQQNDPFPPGQGSPTPAKK